MPHHDEDQLKLSISRIESLSRFLLRLFIRLAMFLAFSGVLSNMESIIVAKDEILDPEDSTFADSDLAKSFCLTLGTFSAESNI